MANQKAQVTLTALNSPLVSTTQRRLHLSPSRRTIRIGRASKSLNKGLVASADNAWFDSPVMSRDHAEILLHSDNKTLQLQDIGSMHGTILNNQALNKKEPRSLSNGDVVKFGAEVRRGTETFPACSFKIEYEFSQADRNAAMGRTIKAPDTSDIEDEEDELNDTDDEDMSDFAASSDLRGKTSSDSEASKRSPSVEIIGEFAGPRGLSEVQALEDIVNMKKPSQSAGNAGNPVVIDSDDDQQTDEEDTDEEMSDNIDDRSDSEELSLDLDTPSILELDSGSESDVDTPDLFDIETSPEVTMEDVQRLSNNQGIEISDIRTTSSSLELWGEISEAEDILSEDSDSDDDSGSDYEVKASRSLYLENEVQAQVPIGAGRSLAASDIESDVESEPADDSEDSDSSEDDDSVELVMGDTMDMDIIYQANETESKAVEEADADTSSDEGSEMEVPSSSDKISKFEIFKKALAADSDEMPNYDATKKASPSEDKQDAVPSILPWIERWESDESASSFEIGKVPAQPTPSAEIAEKASFGREPSPSDAAMVKEDVTPTAASSSAVFGPPKPVPNWVQNCESMDFAQSMGEKHGKTAFFQARAENGAKVKVAEGEADDEAIFIPNLSSWRNQPYAMATPLPSQPSQTGDNPFMGSASAANRIPNPYQRIRERAQEQQRNIQQAHAHHTANSRALPSFMQAHMHHLATALQQNDFSALGTSIRPAGHEPMSPQPRLWQFAPTPAVKDFETPKDKPRSVSINDLVDTNDFSGLVDRTIDSPPPELPQLPSSDSKKRKADAISEVSESEDKSASTSAATEPANTMVSGEASSTPTQLAKAPTAAPEEPVVRAPKRMKRFVEAVGYAALGGAAVGAGLFSVLVATAPDFL